MLVFDEIDEGKEGEEGEEGEQGEQDEESEERRDRVCGRGLGEIGYSFVNGRLRGLPLRTRALVTMSPHSADNLRRFTSICINLH